jgi:hypothetical protein
MLSLPATRGCNTANRAQAIDRALQLAIGSLTKGSLTEPVPANMLTLIAQIEAKISRRH